MEILTCMRLLFPIFRVLISVGLICPGLICVTSISRWLISAAAIWHTPTSAVPIWSGQICLEPTWMWVWNLWFMWSCIIVWAGCTQYVSEGKWTFPTSVLSCVLLITVGLPASEQLTWNFSPSASSVVWRKGRSVLLSVLPFRHLHP